MKVISQRPDAEASTMPQYGNEWTHVRLSQITPALRATFSIFSRCVRVFLSLRVCQSPANRLPIASPSPGGQIATTGSGRVLNYCDRHAQAVMRARSNPSNGRDAAGVGRTAFRRARPRRKAEEFGVMLHGTESGMPNPPPFSIRSRQLNGDPAAVRGATSPPGETN
jgi:hypothetical protein